MRNLEHLIETVHPLDMPRRPSNLKIWNLCADPTKPSKKLLETLGLGLGYGIITKQRDKNPIDIKRLRRATRLKFVEFPLTDDEEDYNPKLRATSDWEPPLAPAEIEDALDEFETNSSDTFKTYRMIPPIFNLEKERIDLLRQVKAMRQFVISATDKNLGPAIMETWQYIERALDDHLDNIETYRELDEEEALLLNEANFRWICHEFIDYPPTELSKKDREYFKKTLCGLIDKDGVTLMKEKIQLPYFYLLPKVHKKPHWKTRPVVSGVSSVLEPLSKWVDVQLQKVVHLCPAYLKDSWHFLNIIKKLGNLKGKKILTADAVSMYTNINTEHAVYIIDQWFDLHEEDLPPQFPRKAITTAIEKLMTSNVFTFGSRFFIQENGTAMGTSCACMYATIYYSYHEEIQLMKMPKLHTYVRLIDDAFLIVDEDVNINDIKKEMDDFGPEGKRLQWDVEPLADSVNFLDLTITIEADGNIRTTTFQKEMNEYLYRPPTSGQPSTILYSLIYGTLHRYYWQNSRQCDFGTIIKLFFDRLTARGHNISKLIPLFKRAAKQVETSVMPNPTPGPKPATQSNSNLLMIHMPYHPQHPPKNDLRDLTINLEAAMASHGCELERIIWAISKAPNIGELSKKNRLEPTIRTKRPIPLQQPICFHR